MSVVLIVRFWHDCSRSRRWSFGPGGDIRVAGELPFANPSEAVHPPLRSHVGDEIIQQDLVNFQRGSVTPFVVRLEAVYRDQTWSAFQCGQ